MYAIQTNQRILLGETSTTYKSMYNVECIMELNGTNNNTISGAVINIETL